MKRNELKIGALISYLNLAIGNLIPFIYTPIMLRLLGQAEYGLYGIANSIMGYIGLLNFGIGGSIVRYIAQYRAAGDQEQERRVTGLFIKIYGVIGALILSAGFILAGNISFYGHSLTGAELDELRILVILMTINTAGFLPLSVFNSVIIAHERFIFNKLLGMIGTVLNPIVNLLLLYAGLGAVGLVISSTMLNFFSYSINIYYVCRKLKIVPSFRPAAPGLLREILDFSFFVFLASIVDVLYWSTDKLIIGWAKGTADTAVYNVGATFNTYLTSLSAAISGLLVPRLTAMAVKSIPKEEFTRIFVKVGRLQFIVVSFIVSAFVIFGRQFIMLWAGTEYARAYYVALLTMLPVSVPLIQNTGLNILYALNKHKFRSIVYTCVAVANVVLTFFWVESYGIVGAAMATCAAYVVGNILIINWYYHYKIGIDIPLFWKNILHMCPVMLGMTAVFWPVISFVGADCWGKFLLLAVIYTVAYSLMAYRFMMNQEERDMISVPVRKLIRRLHRN